MSALPGVPSGASLPFSYRREEVIQIGAVALAVAGVALSFFLGSPFAALGYALLGGYVVYSANTVVKKLMAGLAQANLEAAANAEKVAASTKALNETAAKVKGMTEEAGLLREANGNLVQRLKDLETKLTAETQAQSKLEAQSKGLEAKMAELLNQLETSNQQAREWKTTLDGEQATSQQLRQTLGEAQTALAKLEQEHQALGVDAKTIAEETKRLGDLATQLVAKEQELGQQRQEFEADMAREKQVVNQFMAESAEQAKALAAEVEGLKKEKAALQSPN